MKRIALALLLGSALSAPVYAAPLVAPCLESAVTPGTTCNPVNQANPMPVAPNSYPFNSTPITGVFSGADTSSGTATLAGTAGKFTYIAGFTVSGLGSTSGGTVIVTVGTVSGVNTLSYSYVFTASATTPNTPVNFTFNPPLQASAVNTAIVVTVPGLAGNTATQINAWGYQQ